MIQNQAYWPVFQHSMDSAAFWCRMPLDSLRMESTTKFYRLGCKHNRIRTYDYAINSEGRLLYGGKQVKGWLQLDLKVSVKLVDLQTGDRQFNQVRAIRIRKNANVYQYIWNTSYTVTFNWFKRLQKYTIAENFEIIYNLNELLGQGGFSKVYRVTPIMKQQYQQDQYAAKVYSRGELIMRKDIRKFHQFIQTEVKVLKQIDSPYVCKLHEIIQLEEVLILVTDFAKGTTLYDYLKLHKRLNEAEAVSIIYKLALSLKSVHELNYVHRDIKLENVMINGNDVKMIDFGFAEEICRDKLNSGQGTAGYIAPEIFNQHPYLETSDVFSLGIVFYALLSGRAPFKAPNYDHLLKLNKQCQIDFNDSRFYCVSQRTMNALKGMLKANQSHRSTISQILTQFSTEIDIMDLSSDSVISAEYTKYSQYISRNTMRSFFVQSIRTISEESFKKAKQMISRKSLDERNLITKTTQLKASIQRISQRQLKQYDSEDSEDFEDCTSSNDEIPVHYDNLEFLQVSKQSLNCRKFKH